MPRLNISQARLLWQDAITKKGWQGSVLESVMFDWEKGKPTAYHPNPPAFNCISDDSGTVDEEQYLALQAELILQGERWSDSRRSRDARQRLTQSSSPMPAPISEEDIREAMKAVMATTHPMVVRQEQILRCALIAHLPEEIRKQIGTLSANLHPEIPTASKEYQRKGSKKQRARIDLGFGHPTRCEEIVGVVELKAVTAFTEAWFKSQLQKLNTTPHGVMFTDIVGDEPEKRPGQYFPNLTRTCEGAIGRAETNCEHAPLAYSGHSDQDGHT